MLGNVEMTTTDGSWTHWSPFDNTLALSLLLLRKGPCQWKEGNQRQGGEQEKQMNY